MYQHRFHQYIISWLLLFILLLIGTSCSQKQSGISELESILSILALPNVAESAKGSPSNVQASGPSIKEISPVSAARDVSVTAPIVITFSQPMAATSITPSTLIVTSASGTPINGSIVYTSLTNTATFVPASTLANGSTYFVTITDTPTAISGSTLVAQFTSYFTTTGDLSWLSFTGELNYFVARRDMRLCYYPLCGGYFVSQVNAFYTVCPNGMTNSECYIPALNLSALGLTAEEDASLRQTIGTSTLDTRVVFYGQLNNKLDPNFGRLSGELAVKKAWRANNPGILIGWFYGLKSSNIVCITYPCPTLAEELLNTLFKLNIHGLDFTKAPGTDTEKEAAMTAVASGEGILATGSNYSKPNAGPAGTATIFGASQYFRVVQGSGSVSLPPICQLNPTNPRYSRYEGLLFRNICFSNNDCFKSGCGGEVCASESVITTCEAVLSPNSIGCSCGCINFTCVWR